MMGQQTSDQSQLFYLFNLEQRIPEGHLLRRMNPVVTRVLADLREEVELPLVLPPRSGRRGTRPLDILGQSARPLPRQRPLAPCIRGGGASLTGRWLGQGRRLCRRCERHGGGRQPVSR